jgi:hypothetical protein
LSSSGSSRTQQPPRLQSPHNVPDLDDDFILQILVCRVFEVIEEMRSAFALGGVLEAGDQIVVAQFR